MSRPRRRLAEAARVGAPQAIQVADRWHLWHNLTEAVAGERAALRAAPDADPDESTAPSPTQNTDPPDAHPSPESSTATVPVDAVENVDAVEFTAAIGADGVPEGPLVVRTRERHAAVTGMCADGLSITQIARELGLNRRTVRRFAGAASVEDLLVRAGSRGGLLDPYKPYLHEWFNAGDTDAAALTAAIAERGYRGSVKTVRRYLQPFRACATAPPPTPVPPTVRAVTGWMTCHPDRLDTDNTHDLEAILVRSRVECDVLTFLRPIVELREVVEPRFR